MVSCTLIEFSVSTPVMGKRLVLVILERNNLFWRLLGGEKASDVFVNQGSPMGWDSLLLMIIPTVIQTYKVYWDVHNFSVPCPNAGCEMFFQQEQWGSHTRYMGIRPRFSPWFSLRHRYDPDSSVVAPMAGTTKARVFERLIIAIPDCYLWCHHICWPRSYLENIQFSACICQTEEPFCAFQGTFASFLKQSSSSPMSSMQSS